MQQAISSRMDEIVAALFSTHFDSDRVAKWDLLVPETDKIQKQKELYIKPLLKLLINYLGNGDRALHEIYLDERLRYAPHRLPIEERRNFHRELVDDDFKTLCEAGILDEKYRELWDSIHKSLTESINSAKTVRALAVGDCLFNELRVFARHAAQRKGLELDLRCMYFSASKGGGLNHQAVLDYVRSNPVDFLLFSFFTFEATAAYSRMISSTNQLSVSEIKTHCNEIISMVSDFINGIRESSTQTIILHNASGLPLGRWRKRLPFLPPLSRKQKLITEILNLEMEKLVNASTNTLLMDEAFIANKKGLRECSKEAVSQKSYGGMFHTSYFGNYLAESYSTIFEAWSILAKCKVLLVDFDNTLWKGVMADEKVKHYTDRQQLLLELKNSGILLIALSKNTPDNIRWDEMILKPDDFAALKISWQPKVESILQVAEELNLGRDSFVLIDDNRHERIQVNNEIPEVQTLDPDNPEVWDQLKMMLEFPNTKQTEEAKKRTEMYRQQAQRKKAMNAEVDFASMMTRLNLWYSFQPTAKKQLKRVHELVSRTNQFNTTTQRYTVEQLQSMMDSPNHDIYISEMGDKFGSLGIVAVIVLSHENQIVTIESFILSCRAMGFGLEDQLLYRIEQVALANKSSLIRGLYLPTDRNQPCSEFFASNGYIEGNKGWIKPIPGEAQCEPVQWFTEKHDR